MKLLGDATEVLVGVANAGASRPKRSLAEAQVRRADAVADVVTGYARDRQLDYPLNGCGALASSSASAASQILKRIFSQISVTFGG